MKKRICLLLALTLLLLCLPVRADDDQPWLELFNGKDLSGWEANVRPESFRVDDGVLKVHGRNGMAHLFYVGEAQKDVQFKDFELAAIVRSEPNSNSGIFFHTDRELRKSKYLNKGYEGELDQFFRPPPGFENEFGSYRSPLNFHDGRAVRTAEDWQARRREILARWNEVMGPWPPLIETPKIEYLKTEHRENFTQHHVRVEMAHGLVHPAIVLVPDGKGPFPAAVVPYYNAEAGAGLGKELRDFGYQLTRRGYVTLSVGFPSSLYYPSKEQLQLQPLSALAYAAASCHTALANLPEVDPDRIGIVGHSYGGKWAMFASCLYDRFACAVWSDGGIVFDEKRANVNYWEPWYLGYELGQKQRKAGIPNKDNPRTGAYKTLVEQGLDLHELHALMAPRPFLVSGGSEDRAERWKALNHSIAVNKLLGYEHRVAMTNRRGHSPTAESNEQIYLFFDRFLKKKE